MIKPTLIKPSPIPQGWDGPPKTTGCKKKPFLRLDSDRGFINGLPAWLTFSTNSSVACDRSVRLLINPEAVSRDQVIMLLEAHIKRLKTFKDLDAMVEMIELTKAGWRPL